jgi:hypothetical protein
VDTSELIFEHVSEEVDGPSRILSRIIGKSKRQVVEKQIPPGFQQWQRQNRVLNDEFGFMGAIDIDEIERLGGQRAKALLRRTNQFSAHRFVAGLRDVRIEDSFQRRGQPLYDAFVLGTAGKRIDATREPTARRYILSNNQVVEAPCQLPISKQ